ncbi:methylated-DNA--[protein]-cysteine S-methyltransferase [Radiobacillus deserti]|uniref:Methylated-DNA--protein-cysteine methyltransferase n=1 Tax=Radiobacillus deserti TaxID=2594883 RepID=A0A516KE54_9BACI|nr:methylated-DNA--[protein]-cysteine S-methyltransferase [Radiobacillus deserti]QDP39596.1 methylated-DNA--[protein]-cysteine S-methyltransferase [Radiobacillus deserti]
MSKRSFLFYDEVDTPVGMLTFVRKNQALCRVDFGDYQDNEALFSNWSKYYFHNPQWVKDSDGIFKDCEKQLLAYLNGERSDFSLSYNLFGTSFQQSVWQALTEIPYGETKSYKEIAQAIHASKAIRAVGGAINKNPLSIIIPCHRVIGSNGSLVGYNGGVDKKEYFFKLENAPVNLI